MSHDADPQIVIFKTGVIGATTPNFMLELADLYDMDYVSSDEIRGEVISRNFAKGQSEHDARQVNMGELDRYLHNEARDSLDDGSNLVIDRFYNSPKKRLIPVGLAREYGAVSVALWVDVPEGLAFDRIDRWTQEDSFALPLHDWEKPPAHVLEAMLNNFIEPTNGEPIDHVIKLDGRKNTRDLFGDFELALGQVGLLKYFSVVES